MKSAVTQVHHFDDIEATLTAAKARNPLFADADFTSRLAARLDAMLEEPDSILSLDIFDTLLLRDNTSEITRFLEVGARMAALVSGDDSHLDWLKAGASAGAASPAKSRTKRTGAKLATTPRPSDKTVEAFLARHMGTKATYRASAPVKGCREGSLTEIHQTASTLLTGDDALADAFIKAELNNEAGRLEINPFLRDYIDTHRARGGKVALVTDMYMHRDQVLELLALKGIKADTFDLLISSADTKVSKASGGIFELVEDELVSDSGAFVHLGDSLRGDFIQPRRRGWRAMHLPLADADIIERRRDHLRTSSLLAEACSINVDIAMPH